MPIVNYQKEYEVLLPPKLYFKFCCSLYHSDGWNLMRWYQILIWQIQMFFRYSKFSVTTTFTVVFNFNAISKFDSTSAAWSNFVLLLIWQIQMSFRYSKLSVTTTFTVVFNFNAISKFDSTSAAWSNFVLLVDFDLGSAMIERDWELELGHYNALRIFQYGGSRFLFWHFIAVACYQSSTRSNHSNCEWVNCIRKFISNYSARHFFCHERWFNKEYHSDYRRYKFGNYICTSTTDTTS